MIIAVDFDGTIVEHKYPEIGRELPFAIETLKKLQQERHRLILWSVREGELLQEAVDFCRERGLEFYAVNSNYAEETLESNHYSRKLKADLFIDDRNLGGLPEWGMIYRMIHDKWGYEDIYQSSGNKEETKKAKLLEDTFFQDVESPLPNVVIQAEAHKKTNVRSEESTVISG